MSILIVSQDTHSQDTFDTLSQDTFDTLSQDTFDTLSQDTFDTTSQDTFDTTIFQDTFDTLSQDTVVHLSCIHHIADRYLSEETLEVQVWVTVLLAGGEQDHRDLPGADDQLMGVARVPLLDLLSVKEERETAVRLLLGEGGEGRGEEVTFVSLTSVVAVCYSVEETILCLLLGQTHLEVGQ